MKLVNQIILLTILESRAPYW